MPGVYRISARCGACLLFLRVGLYHFIIIASQLDKTKRCWSRQGVGVVPSGRHVFSAFYAVPF